MKIIFSCRDRFRENRFTYAALTVIILLVEIYIALFVKDRFVRPYVGDMLVTLLICCFVRAVISPRIAAMKWCTETITLCVLAFSFAVEIGQYFKIVDLLGLGGITFFRVLIGTSFSIVDLLCYVIGCGAFCLLGCTSDKTDGR